MAPASVPPAMHIIAAHAHDVACDLTVIATAVAIVLSEMDADFPFREQLADAQGACRRIAWAESGLANYAQRKGGKATWATADALIAKEGESEILA